MSLRIGIHVKAALTDAVSGGRVFPVVEPEGVAMPYVQFECETGEPTCSYDGPEEDNAKVTVRCVAVTYDKAVDMACAVRAALEDVKTEYVGWSVTGCRLMKCSDEYLAPLPAYVETMVFDITSTL